jgi:hypothetical protein
MFAVLAAVTGQGSQCDELQRRERQEYKGASDELVCFARAICLFNALNSNLQMLALGRI